MKPKAMAEDPLRILEQGGYENLQGQRIPIAELLTNSSAGTKLYALKTDVWKYLETG